MVGLFMVWLFMVWLFMYALIPSAATMATTSKRNPMIKYRVDVPPLFC